MAEKKHGMVIESDSNPKSSNNQTDIKVSASLLTKRNEDAMNFFQNALNVSQIKSVVKSPNHFIFIYGFERKFISQISSSAEVLHHVAVHHQSPQGRKEIDSVEGCQIRRISSEARSTSAKRNLAEVLEGSGLHRPYPRCR